MVGGVVLAGVMLLWTHARNGRSTLPLALVQAINSSSRRRGRHVRSIPQLGRIDAVAMDLIAELTFAIQIGLYIVLGLTAVGFCGVFVYYTGKRLGLPIGRKLVRLGKQDPERGQLPTEKDEEKASGTGGIITVLVFAIIFGISLGTWDPRDTVTEGLLKMSLRIGVGQLVVMGFFNVLATLLL